MFKFYFDLNLQKRQNHTNFVFKNYQLEFLGANFIDYSSHRPTPNNG